MSSVVLSTGRLLIQAAFSLLLLQYFCLTTNLSVQSAHSIFLSQQISWLNHPIHLPNAASICPAIEGLHKIRTCWLADCSKVKENRSPRQAFEWVMRNGGITSEANYPYTGRQGECVKGRLKSFASRITGYKRIDNSSELARMAAVAKQPVAVSLALDAAFFLKYKSGTIYSGPCTVKNNHAMAVVGYGATRKGKQYWIVKNSFGPHWGDSGFVYIKRGVNTHDGGLCGISKQAVYPTI